MDNEELRNEIEAPEKGETAEASGTIVETAEETAAPETEAVPADDGEAETVQAEETAADCGEAVPAEETAIGAEEPVTALPEPAEPVLSGTAPASRKKGSSDEEKAASVVEWADAICSAVLICVLLFTFLVKSCVVDGISMVPTYQDGQRVVGLCPYTHFSSGDVVITDANNGARKPLFKRVIATEYQYVSIDTITGAIYVDGELFDDPIAPSADNLKGDITYPFYVPEGCVFVIGDNRRVSNDSRYNEIGFLDMRDITGKVFF